MFVVIDSLMQVERQHESVLDTVTGVFSATLWDLYQRALEAGQVTGDGPASGSLAKNICDNQGHDRGDDGICTRCGDDPFLGSEG